MALTTYSDLKVEIADHLDRDDLTSKIDTFIDLAESRHKRDIRIRQMITRSAITVNARYVSLPTGFLEGISLRLLTNPVTTLSFLTIEQMAQYRQETTGKPTFYTVSNELEFDVAPGESYSGEIQYHKAFTALSDDNTTNDLLTRAPDAYLYGALIASAPYLLNDERLLTWGQLYKDCIDGLTQARRRERSIGGLTSRVYGATP